MNIKLGIVWREEKRTDINHLKGSVYKRAIALVYKEKEGDWDSESLWSCCFSSDITTPWGLNDTWSCWEAHQKQDLKLYCTCNENQDGPKSLRSKGLTATNLRYSPCIFTCPSGPAQIHLGFGHSELITFSASSLIIFVMNFDYLFTFNLATVACVSFPQDWDAPWEQFLSLYLLHPSKSLASNLHIIDAQYMFAELNFSYSLRPGVSTAACSLPLFQLKRLTNTELKFRIMIDVMLLKTISYIG